VTVPKDNDPIDSESEHAIAQINKRGAKGKARVQVAFTADITEDEAASLVDKRARFESADGVKTMDVKEVEYPYVIGMRTLTFRKPRIDIREVDRAVVLDPYTQATGLKVVPDSVSWTNSRTDEPQKVSWFEVETIMYVDRGRGALEGFSYGLGIGAALASVIVFGVYNDPDEEDDDDQFLSEILAFLPFCMAVLMPVVGAIRGAKKGHRDIYHFDRASDAGD